MALKNKIIIGGIYVALLGTYLYGQHHVLKTSIDEITKPPAVYTLPETKARLRSLPQHIREKEIWENIGQYSTKIIDKQKEIIDDIVDGDTAELSKDKAALNQLEAELKALSDLFKEQYRR